MEVQLWTSGSALENNPQMDQTIFSITNLIGQPLKFTSQKLSWLSSLARKSCRWKTNNPDQEFYCHDRSAVRWYNHRGPIRGSSSML